MNITICVTLREFIDNVVGTIYCMAPYHKPRFIDEIVSSVIEKFKADCKSSGSDFFYHEIALKDLYQFIYDTLMPIDKFRDLNLSQREYDAGIKVDDESRAKVVFVDRYTTIADYDDFIDLDACIQNIFSKFELSTFEQHEHGGIDTNKLVQFRNDYENEG